jgi:hypothetical protein
MMCLLLFVFLFFLSSSCEDDDANVLLEEMAAFDKAYIPVLYFVQQGDMGNTKDLFFS